MPQWPSPRPGAAETQASISGSSMRTPLTFTCLSSRPRYSSCSGQKKKNFSKAEALHCPKPCGHWSNTPPLRRKDLESGGAQGAISPLGSQNHPAHAVWGLNRAFPPDPAYQHQLYEHTAAFGDQKVVSCNLMGSQSGDPITCARSPLRTNCPVLQAKRGP